MVERAVRSALNSRTGLSALPERVGNATFLLRGCRVGSRLCRIVPDSRVTSKRDEAATRWSKPLEDASQRFDRCKALRSDARRLLPRGRPVAQCARRARYAVAMASPDLAGRGHALHLVGKAAGRIPRKTSKCDCHSLISSSARRRTAWEPLAATGVRHMRPAARVRPLRPPGGEDRSLSKRPRTGPDRSAECLGRTAA